LGSRPVADERIACTRSGDIAARRKAAQIQGVVGASSGHVLTA
jgi:hypothetical protein